MLKYDIQFFLTSYSSGKQNISEWFDKILVIW